MRVKTLIEFDDIKEGVRRFVGDEFEVSQARFDEVNATGMSKVNKPLLEAVEVEAAEDEDPNFRSMTLKQLQAACGEMGVEVPPKATKAKQVALLGAAEAVG